MSPTLIFFFFVRLFFFVSLFSFFSVILCFPSCSRPFFPLVEALGPPKALYFFWAGIVGWEVSHPADKSFNAFPYKIKQPSFLFHKLVRNPPFSAVWLFVIKHLNHFQIPSAIYPRTLKFVVSIAKDTLPIDPLRCDHGVSYPVGPFRPILRSLCFLLLQSEAVVPFGISPQLIRSLQPPTLNIDAPLWVCWSLALFSSFFPFEQALPGLFLRPECPARCCPIFF